MSYLIESFGITDKGILRAKNQDYFLINHAKNLFLLADGVGGSLAGEVASKLACELFNTYFNPKTETLEKEIQTIFQKLNTEIYAIGQEKPELKGMKTAFLACHIRDTAIYTFHLGDIRAYIYSDKNLKQFTKDHRVLNGLVKEGFIKKKDAEEHPFKNWVSKALGQEIQLEADYNHLPIKKGDIFLLCTDGLWGSVNDKFMQNYFRNEADLEKIANACINEANKNGGQDNISLILIKIGHKTI